MNPCFKVADNMTDQVASLAGAHTRSTFQLNLSRFRHKMYPTYPLIPPGTS